MVESHYIRARCRWHAPWFKLVHDFSSRHHSGARSPVDSDPGRLGLTAAPASRQAMGMGEQASSTIAEDSPTLERERVETWLRRSGGALSLARLLLPEEATIELAQVGRLVLHPRCLVFEAGALAGLATSCEVFSIDAVEGARCSSRAASLGICWMPWSDCLLRWQSDRCLESSAGWLPASPQSPWRS